MTSTTLVMQGKPSDSSRKQQTRLPVIAPKDDHSSSASSNRSLTLATSNVSAPPRARLPPRSRTGCWTCRTRKVKCDEGRPTCGQCTRLGHTCDYSPRLSFRDDTPRVVERMQDISTAGSSVWDPTSPTPTESSASQSAAEDVLPPFTSLTSDEDREKKAEAQSPGTYHVIVNPGSFSRLPEYNEDMVDGTGVPLSSLRRGSLAGSLAASMSSSFGKERAIEGSPVLVADDPNTVILTRFEDSTRRATLRPTRAPPSPRMALQFQTSTEGSNSQSEVDDVRGLSSTDQPPSLLSIAAAGGQDSGLLDHFRTRVWKQMVQIDSDRPISSVSQITHPGADVFEQEAAFFPPLFHAMMAVSALSLAHQESERRLDALQHYQQALPALSSTLRSAEDLTSDGGFLTHFLLLVYEIAAAEPGGSNLWVQHIAQLLRISLMRREVFGGERYPFIIWWVCDIDIYAMMSGAGTGDFVGTMLKNDMMPPPSFHLYPLGIDGSSIVYSHETDTLPLILQLNYEITVLAARLGLLAVELRHEAVEQKLSEDPSLAFRHTDARLRQGRIFELQEAFRQLWTAPNIAMLHQNIEVLPKRSKEVLQNAAVMYRACLIYSYTNMWPSQRMDTCPEFDDEIAQSVTEILQVADSIVSAGRLELRFIVFPLFMAGVASSSGADKMQALDLISSMEKEGIGSNPTSTRHVLQIVYERQTQRFMNVGHSLDVNWNEIMVEQGLQVVNFGL